MPQGRRHRSQRKPRPRRWLWSLALLPLLALPLSADEDPRARILALVQTSQEFERQQAPGKAADALGQAIEVLRAQPGHDRHDLAVLAWRRALLGLRAYQTHASRDCDAPLVPVLARTAEARAAADGAAPDPLLDAQVTRVEAAAALAAGRYAEAAAGGLRAAAALQTGDPCDAAESARIAAQAALLGRDISTAARALDIAEAILAAHPCPSAAADMAVLRARLDIARGDFEAARSRLQALRSDPALGTAPLARGSLLYNLSEIALMQGRYAEAEILNDEARAAYGVLGPAHPVLAQTNHRAAIIRQELGDAEAAEAAYDRALDRLGCRLGPAHPTTLALRRESALLLSRSGDHDAAVARTRATLEAARGAGAGAYDLALDQAALGLVLHAAGDPAAEAALNAAMAAFAAQESADLDRTPGLLALAEIALARGDAPRAETLAREARQILTGNGSTSIQRLGHAQRVLAEALIGQGDTPGALQLARANRAQIETQLADTARLATSTSDLAPAEIRAQIAQLARLLWDRLEAAHDPATEDELFRALQVVHLTGSARATTGLTEAALAQDPALAAHLTEERKLLGRIEGLERALRGEPPGPRLDGFRTGIRSARAELTGLRSALPSDTRQALRKVLPGTVGLAATRAALAPGQALWMQASFDEVTYTAVVTADGSRLTRLPLGAAAIETQVQALRDAVDLPPRRLPKAESFPVAEAFGLYCALFQPDAPDCPTRAETIGEATLAEGAELFLVPDRAMQQIALAMLLTAPLDAAPSLADLRGAPWFARRHPHQSAASIAAFAGRQRDRSANAARAFLGFAPYGPYGAVCADPAPGADGPTQTPPPGLIDPGRARAQARLPHTVELVRTAAATAQAVEGRDWFVCTAATEAALKAQDLSAVDTLLLATHAEVGDLPADLPEPGLFLAAPDRASPRDDGYLKASEIAQMTIRANLVILSACSTGSGSGLPGASGLSGLARAFFTAGARSLIVSHWDVAAISSAALFERLMAERGQHGGLARDLQAAMLGVMATPGVAPYAHPFAWAPFTVVVGR